MMDRRRLSHAMKGASLLALGSYALSYYPTMLRAADPSASPIRSPHGTFTIVAKQSSSDDEFSTVTIVSNRHKNVKHRLPPQIVEGRIDTDHTGFVGDFQISPNDQWIFRYAKFVHTIGIGCLYKKRGEADFRPAQPLRFDEAAWRYYVATHHKKLAAVPTMEEGPRIIDFVSWTPDSRRLVFRLRPIDGYTAAQGYGWTGFYDTVTGKFGSMPPQR